MVLCSASLEGKFSNAAFDVEIFEAVHVDSRKIDDSFVTNEASDGVGDALLALAVGDVDDLGGNQAGEGEPSDNEGGDWMIELIGVGQNVFHHSHTILGGWKASKVEQKHTEEEDEVSIGVSDIGELKSSVHKEDEKEEDLDEMDEAASVEKV